MHSEKITSAWIWDHREHQEQSHTIDELKENGLFNYSLLFDIRTTTTCQPLRYQLEVGSTLHTMPYFFMFSFSEQLAIWCSCVLLAFPQHFPNLASSVLHWVFFPVGNLNLPLRSCRWMKLQELHDTHFLNEHLCSSLPQEFYQKGIYCTSPGTQFSLTPITCFSLLYNTTVLLQTSLWLCQSLSTKVLLKTVR